MESAVAWKAAMNPAPSHTTWKTPAKLPPAFPTAPTAPASDEKENKALKPEAGQLFR